MWKIIFVIHKAESMLIGFEHRKLLGACLVTISPSLDCISKERIEKLHIALLVHLPLMTTIHWCKLSSYQKCQSRFELLMLIKLCPSILKVVWNKQPMAGQYWSTKSKFKFCTLWKSLFLNRPKRKNCKPKCD